MKFNSKWSERYSYDPNSDDFRTIESWNCKGVAGIYAISDEFDERVLYVGKAEGTSRDIHSRLQAHLQDRGNAGIGDLVSHQQCFTVRFAQSEHPSLSESIAIVQLQPLFNKRSEWAGIDLVSVDECLTEAERLGLITSREQALDNLARAVAEQLFNSSDRPGQQRIRSLEHHDLPIEKDFNLDRFS